MQMGLSFTKTQRSLFMARLYFCLLAILMLSGFGPGCSGDGPRPDTAAQQKAVPPSGRPAVVEIPFSQVRKGPGTAQEAIATLSEGDTIWLSGEIGQELTQVRVGERTFEMPWVHCHLKDGKEGWVHPIAIRTSLPVEEWVALAAGANEAQMVRSYEAAFSQREQSAAANIAALLKGQELCRALTQAAAQKPEAQLALLRGALPAVVPSAGPDGQLSFYPDYRVFGRSAMQTLESADDRVLEVFFFAFPVDSIGYALGCWQLEDGKGRVFSLLGRGKHLQLLQLLDEAAGQSDEAGEELGRLKGAVFNDVIAPGVLYWEPKEKALAELTEIYHAPLSVVNPADTALIGRVLRLWAAAPDGDQRFNHRAGVLLPME